MHSCQPALFKHDQVPAPDLMDAQGICLQTVYNY